MALDQRKQKTSNLFDNDRSGVLVGVGSREDEKVPSVFEDPPFALVKNKMITTPTIRTAAASM